MISLLRYPCHSSIQMFMAICLLSAFPSVYATETVTAKMTSGQTVRTLDGVTEAVHQSTISAQVTGRVERLFFDVGDYVKKGEILVQFRDREVRARYNAAKAEYKEAEKEYRRIQDIFTKKLVARAAVDKAEARFKSARARLEQSNENLRNTRVHAPYSGIVVKRSIQVGELARVGQQLMTGLSLEALRVVVNVPQDMINAIRILKQARVYLPDGKQINAESITFNPYADPVSHTFNIRVNLPKQDFNLYPGMLLKVGFVIGKEMRLLVPLVTVARRSEVSAVYVVGSDGKISFRQVRVGAITPGHRDIEILSGLEAGEKLLLDTVKAARQLKSQGK
ncbi:MAG TPA: efflux RND transporter periplasmic adaptor subunit [Gammaproteobacteria bacterium]|nr:efflux RND transporter periplasmic adaptor subunit [Gammaproteobacteria bacterium]